MQLKSLPLFDQLEDAKNILLAGAGGGYDIYAGIPLYFSLRDTGKEVVLANLTFSNLYGVEGRQLAPEVMEVDADSGGLEYYFPEKYLCRWLQTQGVESSIHCFYRTGAKPVCDAYRAICEEYAIDTIILVDGGTDSLMRGDECGLGTPWEDAVSIAAVDEADVERKFLACIGFGVDSFHGVNHALYLENVAELTKQGGFLGAFSLLPNMPEAKLYKAACEYAFAHMPEDISIVSSSILAAVRGEYGDYHSTSRTKGSVLWINPFMAMYWCFELDAVANSCLYLDDLKKTVTYLDVQTVIGKHREHCRRAGTVRPPSDMPG